MLQQGSGALRYSLEGFLKRVLHCAPCPLTEEGLVEAVLSDWAGPDQARESISARVRASLQATNGAFTSVAEDKYMLRHAVGDDLQNLSYQYLTETGQPQKLGDILRYLQKVTGRGRGELMSRVDLDCDPRFVRMDGGEWLLTEWEPVNDHLARLMVERGQRRGELSSLLALLGEEQDTHQYQIFYPEYDPRFTVNGDVVECLLVEREVAVASNLDTNLEEEKVEELKTEQTLMTQKLDELASVPTPQLVAAALQHLSLLSAALQERNQAIPNEVLTLFNSEDLAGIESLMGERKRVGALADDLASFVTKWSE